MTKMYSALAVMNAALAAFLWVARIVSGDIAWRIAAGGFAVSLLYTGSTAFVAGWREANTKRRSMPDPFSRISTPDRATFYTAGGPIVQGDFVRFDPNTGRVIAVPHHQFPEKPVQ